MSVSPSRRRLLQAALLSPVAACTSHAPQTPAALDPDVALRQAAIARERQLLELYSSAVESSPALAATLGAIRAEHEEHLAALAPPATSASPVAPRVLPAVHPVALVAAERSAASAHAAAALLASRPLAALLASLAASEASHPVALP
ncbi:MAG: hypothetical protein JWP11_3510 [Frankiales bacterium]|jgi:hypothetical protein|nr:hypothetical protein [Frankiales bacterium]